MAVVENDAGFRMVQGRPTGQPKEHMFRNMVGGGTKALVLIMHHTMMLALSRFQVQSKRK